jgi:transposase
MYPEGFRKAALTLYGYFQNMKKTAQALQVATSTIWRWVHGMVGRAGAPCHVPKKKLSEAMLAHISTVLSKNPTLTLDALRISISETFGLATLSRQCVAAALRASGFSRKRLRLRGTIRRQDPAACLALFKRVASDALHSGNIVAVDEVGFDRTMVPLYGYAPRGEKAVVRLHRTDKERVSVIMAIDPKGRHHYRVITGTTDGNCFAQFVASLHWPTGTHVILDNASIHKTRAVRAALTRNGLVPLYTPPYTPDANPIENVFSVVKHRYRKALLTAPGSSNIADITQLVIGVLDGIDCLGLYSNCFRHLSDWLKKIDIVA